MSTSKYGTKRSQTVIESGGVEGPIDELESHGTSKLTRTEK